MDTFFCYYYYFIAKLMNSELWFIIASISETFLLPAAQTIEFFGKQNTLSANAQSMFGVS